MVPFEGRPGFPGFFIYDYRECSRSVRGFQVGNRWVITVRKTCSVPTLAIEGQETPQTFRSALSFRPPPAFPTRHREERPLRNRSTYHQYAGRLCVRTCGMLASGLSGCLAVRYLASFVTIRVNELSPIARPTQFSIILHSQSPLTCIKAGFAARSVKGT